MRADEDFVYLESFPCTLAGFLAAALEGSIVRENISYSSLPAASSSRRRRLSAAPRSVVVGIRCRRAPSASRYVSVSLRQRLIQVPLLHAIYPVIEAHLGIYKGHGDDLLHDGNTLSAKVNILLGAPAFYII